MIPQPLLEAFAAADAALAESQRARQQAEQTRFSEQQAAQTLNDARTARAEAAKGPWSARVILLPQSWADVQARAEREGWPLVTGVGCDAPRSANWLSARREDWPGFTAPCVVVAASRGGRWWGRVLPSDASWGAVDAAVRDAARAAEPAEVPAFAPYVPPVYQAPMPTFPTPSFAPAFMPPASFGGFGGGFSRGGSRSC